jgi:hypothetical protein
VVELEIRKMERRQAAAGQRGCIVRRDNRNCLVCGGEMSGDDSCVLGT